jgi:hypothetical protein
MDSMCYGYAQHILHLITPVYLHYRIETVRSVIRSLAEITYPNLFMAVASCKAFAL